MFDVSQYDTITELVFAEMPTEHLRSLNRVTYVVLSVVASSSSKWLV